MHHHYHLYHCHNNCYLQCDINNPFMWWKTAYCSSYGAGVAGRRRRRRGYKKFKESPLTLLPLLVGPSYHFKWPSSHFKPAGLGAHHLKMQDNCRLFHILPQDMPIIDWLKWPSSDFIAGWLQSTSFENCLQISALIHIYVLMLTTHIFLY